MIRNSKRKVLIVSFLFPPLHNIGAVRIGKFAKYLPEFNWDPIVLTADNMRHLPQTIPVEIDEKNVIRTCYFGLGDFIEQTLIAKNNTSFPIQINKGGNATLKSKILKMIRLIRPIYTLPMMRTLLLEPIGWYYYAVKKGLHIATKYNIDIIFSTYSPATSHFVASYLNRRTGIPWVAEFRDLWTLNHNIGKTQPFYFIEQQIEKRTLRNSNLLITASEPMTQEMEALHSKKCITITNGFDEQDFIENIPLIPRFTITYTGNMYLGKQDPSPLFKAIARLIHEGRIIPGDLEVRFFGSSVLDIISLLIKDFCLQQFVRIYDSVPLKESIKKQKESTVLLLLAWNDPKEKGVYTAKIFEYLGATRPILVIGSKGSVIDELLVRTSSGVIATEVEEIKEILSDWLSEFRLYKRILSHYTPKQEVIKLYTRKEQARKLAEVFNKVLRTEIYKKV